MAKGFEISIKSDVKKLTRHLNKLQRKVIPAVTVRALNKTGTTVTANAARLIKLETKLPIGRIKKKLPTFKANKTTMRWEIKGLRGSTNIIEWVPPSKQKVGAFRKQRGVRSRAWGTSKVYPGAFIARGKNSGKLLVFIRDDRKASGVRDVYGPSVRSAFIRVLKELKPLARKRFAIVFNQELKHALSKIK